MHESIQSWMEQAAANAGVLACGVRLADRSFVVKSCNEIIAEAQLTQAMRDLSDAIYFLQQNRITAGRLRWTFENARICCVTRPGGVMAALVLTPETADLPEIEQLLSDFSPT